MKEHWQSAFVPLDVMSRAWAATQYSRRTDPLAGIARVYG